MTRASGFWIPRLTYGAADEIFACAYTHIGMG